MGVGVGVGVGVAGGGVPVWVRTLQVGPQLHGWASPGCHANCLPRCQRSRVGGVAHRRAALVVCGVWR